MVQNGGENAVLADSNAGSGVAQKAGEEEMDGARGGVRCRRDASPTRSAQSKDRVNPEAPGWTKRLHLGSAPPDRVPCPSRMSAVEQTIRKYAEQPEKSVIRPELELVPKRYPVSSEITSLQEKPLDLGVKPKNHKENHRWLKGIILLSFGTCLPA